jgi:SAM-dependent methyltransferase
VIAGLYWRAAAAVRHARKNGAPGLALDDYGRKLGRRLLLHGEIRKGVSHALHPVALSRYFEDAFAASAVPDRALRCLDLSSPRLFSLFFAEAHRAASVTMLNPDRDDLAVTQRIARRLRIGNLKTEPLGVDALADRKDVYDCAWSISVIEHISGRYDDRAAIRWLFESVRPGGCLVLTIPVDRMFHEEFRDEDPYGTQPRDTGQRYFFQRWYDWSAIDSRLLGPLGHPPYQAQFFGETDPGRFLAWDTRSRQEGLRLTVDDPREIADHYRVFPDWATMPGVGVCGLRIEKR